MRTSICHDLDGTRAEGVVVSVTAIEALGRAADAAPVVPLASSRAQFRVAEGRIRRKLRRAPVSWSVTPGANLGTNWGPILNSAFRPRPSPYDRGTGPPTHPAAPLGTVDPTRENHGLGLAPNDHPQHLTRARSRSATPRAHGRGHRSQGRGLPCLARLTRQLARRAAGPRPPYARRGCFSGSDVPINRTQIVHERSVSFPTPAQETAYLQEIPRIGETGFEPATARPPAGCATRLRHSPWYSPEPT
jgi:hypothetical protein